MSEAAPQLSDVISHLEQYFELTELGETPIPQLKKRFAEQLNSDAIACLASLQEQCGGPAPEGDISSANMLRVLEERGFVRNCTQKVLEAQLIKERSGEKPQPIMVTPSFF